MNVDLTLVEAFAQEHPLALAKWLETRPPEQAASVLADLSPAAAARTLSRTLPALAARLLELLPVEGAGKALGELDPFTASRLLARILEGARERLVAKLPRSSRDSVTKLLDHSPDQTGARMDPRAPSAPSSATVQEGLSAIESARDGALNYLYVTDAEHRLVGVISIRELLSASRSEPLSEVMNDAPDRLRSTDPIQRLVSHPAWREVHALPVVDSQDRLLGAIRYSTFRALETELGLTLSGPDPSRTANALAEILWLGTLAAVRTAETAVFGGQRPASEERA